MISKTQFDEESFRNLVEFYRPELERVNDGTKARDVFETRHERVKLVKKGVLICFPTQQGKQISLSERTKTVLNI